MFIDTFLCTHSFETLFLHSQIMLDVFCGGSLDIKHVVLNHNRFGQSRSYPKLLQQESMMQKEEHQGKSSSDPKFDLDNKVALSKTGIYERNEFSFDSARM